jgi:2-keto-4-pentenoate hydratase/2-oxohepta-3-ene-1,7-dioic acid hydratase in catechol pathway
MLDFMRLDVPGNQPYLARSFPTHKVISHELVPVRELQSVSELPLSLRVDGKTLQQSTTANLIAPPDQLVMTIAKRCRLASGDLVMTGSPGGRPADRDGPWIEPGSLIEGEIPGVGTVTAYVTDECDEAHLDP